MNVREAARDPIQSNRLGDGRLAIFDSHNDHAHVIGDAVAVER